MFCSIRLNKQNLSCEYICKHIQHLVSQHSKSVTDLSDSVLTVEIKSIQDSSPEYSGPLRIEYKDKNLTE